MTCGHVTCGHVTCGRVTCEPAPKISRTNKQHKPIINLTIAVPYSTAPRSMNNNFLVIKFSESNLIILIALTSNIPNILETDTISTYIWHSIHKQSTQLN